MRELIDKTYLLHHPALAERLPYMMDCFNKLNMSVNIVDQFPPDAIDQLGRCKNTNQASLTLKHRHCIERQVISGHKYILIIEDDAVLIDNENPDLNFNDLLDKSMKEFVNMDCDLMFIGICCGIQPINIEPNKHVYYHPSYKTRCTHCYVSTLEGAKKIIKHMYKDIQTIDYFLNEIIQKENLKCCYVEPGIHQGTQRGTYKSSLYN